MSRHEIEELTHAAYDAGYNPTGVSLLEEAVRIADTMQDIELQWRLRNNLVDFAAHGGRPERALVAFAWLVGHEENYGDDPWIQSQVTWKYKWMLEQTVFMHELPFEQLQRLADDLEARYRDNGGSLRPLYNLRAWQLFWTGHSDWSNWRKKWLEAPRDGGADCTACESNFRAFYAFESGDWAGALKAADGILRGHESCAEIPQITFGYILPAIERVDGIEAALAHQATGYRDSRDNPDFVMELGGQIAFLSHHARFEAALSLFERHANWPMVNSASLRNAHFLAAATGLLERLDDEHVPIHLPDEYGVSESDHGHRRATLIDSLDQRVREVAQKFDARNGNDWVSRRLDSVRSFAAGAPHPESSSNEPSSTA